MPPPYNSLSTLSVVLKQAFNKLFSKKDKGEKIGNDIKNKSEQLRNKGEDLKNKVVDFSNETVEKGKNLIK